MAEATVYAIIGGIMMACFVVGGAMSANVYSPPEIKGAGSLMILGGFVLLMILLGIGGYDIWKWYSGWSLDRRSDALERKLDRIRIKEREDEIKQREREYLQERQKREDTRQRSTSADNFSHQPYQPIPPRQEPKVSGHSPIQNLEKPSEQKFEEEPILQTGGIVPPYLQKKSEDVEPEEILEAVEKDSPEEEYVRYVKSDPVLRSLWYLYNSKEGIFLGQAEAARIIYEVEEGQEASGSRRQEIKASMTELGHYDLIAITSVKDDIKKRKVLEYKITPKGRELMKLAIDENIRRWVDFVEKYKFDLKK